MKQTVLVLWSFVVVVATRTMMVGAFAPLMARSTSVHSDRGSLAATTEKDSTVTEKTSAATNMSTAESTTEKYGLEAGLFESFKSQDANSAKSLLQKYGIAYLATSIPLAMLSFAICYVLVDQGVDMGALLSKVGIAANPAGETAGTVAIAYAAHKAASPIRFPPTVLLTPIVAKWIGKEPNNNDKDGETKEAP